MKQQKRTFREREETWRTYKDKGRPRGTALTAWLARPSPPWSLGSLCPWRVLLSISLSDAATVSWSGLRLSSLNLDNPFCCPLFVCWFLFSLTFLSLDILVWWCHFLWIRFALVRFALVISDSSQPLYCWQLWSPRLGTLCSPNTIPSRLFTAVFLPFSCSLQFPTFTSPRSSAIYSSSRPYWGYRFHISITLISLLSSHLYTLAIYILHISTLQKLLNTEDFRHNCLYAQKLLHRKDFAHNSFYTQKLLHTDAFHTEAFAQQSSSTHRNFYTQKLLHREAFYTQKSLWHRKF